MKTTKRILICALAASMTAATIWAQKDVPENTHAEELEQLVDLAEMDLLADMLESLLRDEENADSNSIDDSQIPESGLADIPGMNIDIYGNGFDMSKMCAFGCFPVMAGFNGMGNFGVMGGFGGYPMMVGFGDMGGFCGF